MTCQTRPIPTEPAKLVSDTPITLSDGTHVYTVELSKDGKDRPLEKYLVRARTAVDAIRFTFGSDWPIKETRNGAYAESEDGRFTRDAIPEMVETWTEDDLPEVITEYEAMKIGEAESYQSW